MHVYNIIKSFSMFYLRRGSKGLHINKIFLFLEFPKLRTKSKNLESRLTYWFTYYSFRNFKHFACNGTHTNCKILTIPLVREPHYLFKCFVHDKPKYYFSNTKIRLLQKNTRFVDGPMYG